MKAIRHFHFGASTPSKGMRRSEYMCAGKTVVVDNCPTCDELRSLIVQQVMTKGRPIHYPLHVGIAILHPDDQYNKKVGVEVASKKAVDVGYYVPLVNIYSLGTEIITEIEFSNVDKDARVNCIRLRVHNQGKYPEIIGCSYNYASSNPKLGGQIMP